MIMPRTVVFTGPSLNPVEVAHIDGATILPPIKRGDLKSIRGLEPEVIGIIDGEFHQSLAVSPKEILPFLEDGVRVYGAASMGALRAVELRKFGMIGIGRVFRLFSLRLLDCDDEVALKYCPCTFQAHSEPLVNTRYALRAGIRNGILTRTEASKIIASLRTLYYPERTRSVMIRIARGIVGCVRAACLEQFLASRPVNVKNADARMLIAELSRQRLKVPETPRN